MKQAVLDGEVAFDPDVHQCVVVLCETEHGNLHIGLLHKVAANKAAVLHLGWHNYMSREWPWLRLYVCPDTEPEKLRLASAKCRLVWTKFEQDGTLPYALGDFASTFDSAGGLKLAEGSEGLTCATFAMAIFRSVGVEIVQEKGWPIRVQEDRRWLEQIGHFAHPDHLRVLVEQVENGVARVHPHELLAAASLTPLPADYTRISAVAGSVIERLDAAIGR